MWHRCDMRGALARKNKIVIFSQVFSRAKFCFFLHKPLQCPNTTKICTQLADPSLFDAKKFHIFLNFLTIFWMYCSQAYIFIGFPLTRALGMYEQHETLHTPCEPEYLWSHKFSDFLEFFCYFFRMVKALWPSLTCFDRTVTTQKGISVCAPNGGGANLSMLWN